MSLIDLDLSNTSVTLDGLKGLEGAEDGGVPEALCHTAGVERIDGLGMEMRVGFGRFGRGRGGGWVAWGHGVVPFG